MDNDVAIFLDLDNVVIGASEAHLAFDISLVLEHIRSLTNGRIVMRRAYGDWRQREALTKELASAGFELQSTVRLNSMSKNLADMQMVVDAMSTLIDGHDFATYVLLTGDRDFVPLVQALRKRGKQVIGIGIKHASSQSLERLCDRYVYYDNLVSTARQLMENQFEDLLRRAAHQLLQDESRVPASLLKQRMQALSKGSFGRSPLGRRNFRKLLSDYPDIVRLVQEGTTLYISRPGAGMPTLILPSATSHPLAEDDVQILLRQALAELTTGGEQVRASLLKQRMQELSAGAFDQTKQGDRSFRKFLERHRQLVQIRQEGSTLYVGMAGNLEAPEERPMGYRLPAEEEELLLQQALNELLQDQPRVRASLLKQHMQELSDAAFDESSQGAKSFRRFLERYPNLVRLQQRGSTLMVGRPPDLAESAELYLRYRSELKKRGLRVVRSAIRLVVLRDLLSLLQRDAGVPWRQLVRGLSTYYHDNGHQEISRSLVNDVLRIALKAQVVEVHNEGSLATAPVFLRLGGDRLFQDAVIRCDAAYLSEIQNLVEPFNLEQAALALYETAGYARYLKVVQSRYLDDLQVSR